MRLQSVIAATAVAWSTLALAQSEAEIMRYAEEGLPLVRSGQLSPVVYYKEVFRRIQLTPSSEYQFKAENLRLIGERIDIYEAVEAGQITMEKAERLVAQQQAGADKENLDRERTAQELRQRQMREAARQQELAEAQDAAQRRALALQLLQGYRPPQPVQIQPYQMQTRQQTNCTSQWMGGQLVTRCQ